MQNSSWSWGNRCNMRKQFTTQKLPVGWSCLGWSQLLQSSSRKCWSKHLHLHLSFPSMPCEGTRDVHLMDVTSSCESKARPARPARPSKHEKKNQNLANLRLSPSWSAPESPHKFQGSSASSAKALKALSTSNKGEVIPTVPTSRLEKGQGFYDPSGILAETDLMLYMILAINKLRQRYHDSTNCWSKALTTLGRCQGKLSAAPDIITSSRCHLFVDLWVGQFFQLA